MVQNKEVNQKGRDSSVYMNTLSMQCMRIFYEPWAFDIFAWILVFDNIKKNNGYHNRFIVKFLRYDLHGIGLKPQTALHKNEGKYGDS